MVSNLSRNPCKTTGSIYHSKQHILGSGTAVLLLGNKTEAALVAALIITVLNAFALVFGFSDKARLHADLRRRFIDLETLANQGEDTQEKLEEIQAIRNQIEADEPPTKRIVAQLCAIAIYRSRGDEDMAARYKIPFLKQVFGHYYNFELPAPRS